MCFSKPTQQQNVNQSQTGNVNTASTAAQGPTPETLALYQQFLANALGVSQAPFDPNTLGQMAPWTDALNAAVNNQWALGQQGMGFVPQAAALIQGAGQSTIPQIGDVASMLTSPYGGQAATWGQDYGQQASGWGTTQGQSIADYASQMQQAAPQFQQFSQQAVDQYLSPYIKNVVDATQAQFNNQNAIQSSALLGQGIKAGNVFGGDRAGVSQGILAGQQQLAQAPVIANLYNQGYAQALQEYNVQNALAAQMAQLGLQGQVAGGQLGLQGILGGGGLGLQGLGIGMQGDIAANAQAIQALAQNQQAGLQAGSLLGQLGATQYGANLAGGQQAIGAAGIYPNYIQQLLNMQQQNALMQAGYPFQTTGWYGSLLGGLGPLTGQVKTGVGTTTSNQIGTGLSELSNPQQNFSNILSLGLGALGLLGLKHGGLVGYAKGGSISDEPYSESKSYVPRLKLPERIRANLPEGDEKADTPRSLNLGSLTSNLKGPSDSGSGTSKAFGSVGSKLGNTLSNWFAPSSGMSTALSLMKQGWSGSDFPAGAAPFQRGGGIDDFTKVLVSNLTRPLGAVPIDQLIAQGYQPLTEPAVQPGRDDLDPGRLLGQWWYPTGPASPQYQEAVNGVSGLPIQGFATLQGAGAAIPFSMPQSTVPISDLTAQGFVPIVRPFQPTGGVGPYAISGVGAPVWYIPPISAGSRPALAQPGIGTGSARKSGGIVDMRFRNGGWYANGGDTEDEEEDSETATRAGVLAPGYINAIKSSEGYTERPQWDYRQYSSGYGTRALGPNERMTPELAESRLNDELRSAAAYVDRLNPNLDPGSRAALTSLTYNAGPGWTNAGLGRAVAAGDIDTARQRFLQYVNAGGRPLPGLVSRRQQEAQWFGGDEPLAAAPAAVQQQALAQAGEGGISPRMIADISQLRQQRPMTWAQRWAASPFTQLAMGLAGAPSVAAGFARGLQNIQGQREAEMKLDQNWSLDNSGMTQKVKIGNQLWDLGLPTDKAIVAQERSSKEKDVRIDRIAKDLATTEGIPYADARRRAEEIVERGVPAAFAPPGSASPAPSDGIGARPAPPGVDPKEWRKQETKRLATEEVKREGQEIAAQVVTKNIDRALKITDNVEGWLPTTGFIGDRLKDIGGTAANDLNRTLDTIRANVGFDKLQQMRAMSPSGGALGQVSDFENRLLQAVLGNLEQSQTKDQFKRNLIELKDTYDAIINRGIRPGEEVPKESKPKGETAEPAKPKSKAEYDALPSGAHYIGKDGRERIKK